MPLLRNLRHGSAAAARQQHPGASNMRGFYFDNGMGGQSKDAVAASDWYLRGAELGDDTAALNIGRNYADGSGVERDDAEARRNYRNAARGGDCEAMDGLAALYDNGQGVARDLRMAQVFYAMAARGSETMQCPGAAEKAQKMGARLDAATLADAQATAAAWKEGAFLLPDEVEEAAKPPR